MGGSCVDWRSCPAARLPAYHVQTWSEREEGVASLQVRNASPYFDA